MSDDTRIRLTIAGAGDFIITVQDGIAEIRGEHQRAHERHRHLQTSISTHGVGVPISLSVRAEDVP